MVQGPCTRIGPVLAPADPRLLLQANYSPVRAFQAVVDTALERAEAELSNAVSTIIWELHNGGVPFKNALFKNALELRGPLLRPTQPAASCCIPPHPTASHRIPPHPNASQCAPLPTTPPTHTTPHQLHTTHPPPTSLHTTHQPLPYHHPPLLPTPHHCYRL